MQRWIFLFLLAALWAPSFLLIKIALVDIPPITLATIRLLGGALLLLAVLRVRGGKLPTSGKDWRNLAVMGLFGSALPFAAISIGEQFTDSGLAAIFTGATPISTAVLAHFLVHDEKMTPTRLTGVLLGFVGILSIFIPELGGGHGSAVGVILFAVAAVSYGLGMVHARLHLRGMEPLVAPALQLAIGAAMLLPFVAFLEGDQLKMPGTEAFWAILFLTIFGTAIAYFVYYRILELAGATFLSLVTYLLPPAGVMLGVIFLDESPRWYAYAGCGLIVLGVMLMNNVLRFSRRPAVATGATSVE